MTRGRSRSVDRIVVRYISTLASALNNAICFSHSERQGSSAYYFVDGITVEIYQSVAEADIAWHAGDRDMNCRSIGNGDARHAALGSRYAEVQAEVNRLLGGGSDLGGGSSGA